MKKTKIIKNIIIVLFIIFILAFLCIWYISNYTLEATYYTVESDKIEDSIRIVQLTDLHNHEFGPDNEKLISLIKEQDPDIIIMTGDMINRVESGESTYKLIENLTDIAPVYYSLGNHEYEYTYNGLDYTYIMEKVEEAGATMLEQQYIDTEINGNAVRIGGLYGYVLSEAADFEDGSQQVFMHEFEETDSYKILLSHKSEGLLLWNSMETYDVDIIFSGHIHGGEIRLPILGGLYSSEEGFFPEYTSGVFEKSGSVMILSRGLGTGGLWFKIPTRWNNIPELIVVDVE